MRMVVLDAVAALAEMVAAAAAEIAEASVAVDVIDSMIVAGHVVAEALAECVAAQ